MINSKKHYSLDGFMNSDNIKNMLNFYFTSIENSYKDRVFLLKINYFSIPHII